MLEKLSQQFTPAVVLQFVDRVGGQDRFSVCGAGFLCPTLRLVASGFSRTVNRPVARPISPILARPRSWNPIRPVRLYERPCVSVDPLDASVRLERKGGSSLPVRIRDR